MHRDAPLTFTLDDGLYEAPILHDVTLEDTGATVVGRWQRFGLLAEGRNSAEVYRDLLSMLTQLLDDPLSAQNLPPLAELMRSSGRRIPPNEISRREDAWLRNSMLPWTIDGRHYHAALFANSTVERRADHVIVSAFGTSATGADLTAAAGALRRDLTNLSAAPGPPAPVVADIDQWVMSHGRLAGDDSVQAARQMDLSAIHDAVHVLDPNEIEPSSNTRPVLVQCWSDDCSWCVVQAPVLVALAEEYAGRVLVGKVHIGRHPDIAERFTLRYVPTLLLIDKGRELHRIEGHRGERTIVGELRPHLGD